MFIYILVLICSSAAVEDRQNLWDILGNIFDITHEAYVPEDARLNITQLAQKHQYPLEEHTVTTQDGYIINMHRISNHRDGRNRPVVFLMHGITENSISWLLLGPNNALGYLLADQGFDVWMGNNRGNQYAQMHTTLNYTMAEYWQYSWEEIALYDLSAMIDYILNATGQDSLYYVGHSQGSTIGYVLCSMKPEYNNKIKTMFSLAPVAWMGHIQSPLVKLFSPAHDVLGYMLSSMDIHTIGMGLFKKISTLLCSIWVGSCDDVVDLLSGHETKVNKTFLSVILGHWPSASSTMQFVHYGQLVESHRFCRYDYGVEQNMEKYGMSSPPDYDLSLVSVPVVLYYSPKDVLSDPQDVLILRRQLPNVKEIVFLEDFTHIDYVYATDAVDSIYSDIINHLKVFEGETRRRNLLVHKVFRAFDDSRGVYFY